MMRHWVVLFGMLAAPVIASGLPPVVSKSFTPPVVAVNQSSTMTITLTNPNPFSLSGASISDTFPLGLVNAGPFPGTASTNCAGAVLSPGPTAISMTNGVIPANGNCTITVPVLSATPGSYQNDTGSLFTGGGASLGGASATLLVVPPAQIPALSVVALLSLATSMAALALSRLRT